MKSSSELNDLISEAKSKVNLDKKYKHYKYPNRTYVITDILIIEETKNVGIVYREINGERASIKFLRTLENFIEKLIQDGKVIQRFTPID